jgi:leader peptidase (prepilin peptidase)/N-methyltransferase
MTIFPSFLVLGAKCRHCKEPIAVRYPIVEALGGLSFLAVTLGALFGAYSPWILPELYVFAAVSIVIAYIDLDHHLILNVVLLPTLIATLALLALASLGTNEWNRLGRAVICAIVLGAFYLLLSIIWKGGMGDGDIKLAFILGLITGWLGWSQFIIGAFAAFFIGGFLSLVLIIGKKVDMHGGIPFGPSMLLGIWLGIFVGAPIATLYLQVTGLA